MKKFSIVCFAIFLAGCGAKEQASVDNDAAIRKGFEDAASRSVPALDTSKKSYNKADIYHHQ